MKGQNQFDTRFSDEIDSKERQYNKLNSEFVALKSSLALLEEDKNYH